MNVRTCAPAVVMLTGIVPFTAHAQTTASAPVAINSCGPMLNNNSSQTLFGVPVTSTSSGIRIQFTNESSKTANLINFSVDSNGDSFVIRDLGTFSSGVEITHRYTNGSGQAYLLPQFVAPKITCRVQSVGFTDGSVWRRGEASPSSQPPQVLNPLSVTPASVAMDRNSEAHLFMASSTAKIAAFSETDTCGGIASVSLSASGEDAATYVVKPLASGTCSAMIRDQSGNSVMVPITVH